VLPPVLTRVLLPVTFPVTLRVLDRMCLPVPFPVVHQVLLIASSLVGRLAPVPVSIPVLDEALLPALHLVLARVLFPVLPSVPLQVLHRACLLVLD
jgi:hypothetical protein